MADEISPDTGAPISGETAKRWIANYRERHPEPDEKIACFYGSKIITQLLAQADCIGIRIYFSYDDKGDKQMILVGVNSTGNNIWNLDSSQPLEGGLVAEVGGWCPPICPTN